MTYATIRVEEVGPGVGLLTLDRPDVMNAYTTEMCEEVVAALDAYARDDTRRVLVITGEGRGFCSGGNLADGTARSTAEARQLGHAIVMREGFHRLSLALRRLDKPVIAMVNGPAVAGGLTLALLCDFRIASDRAVFGDPSGTAGLLPDEGGAWLFPRAMGLDHALRMVMLGERYDARRALELGLVTEVVPHAELRERTLAMAGSLAARAPLAVRLAKRMMYRSLEATFESSLGDAELSVMIANASEDAGEGVQAFLARRPPDFRGR
ncbi:MAG: enoyl-CoA hydratase/isomerase family protein [Streptosporangiales bacterium]|nr:enoyl-CoA hydratase/isomerase family protein [Streptosporangiales bacterium]